jgi:hypothetical protein
LLKYKFSGHQTFAFRYGWLEKGVRAVTECPTVFTDDDAMVRLGVGKNMVASIRHWCQVTQLIEQDLGVSGDKGAILRVTSIGQRLLGLKGWDPFMENDATLWMLHWLMVTNPLIGTIWQLLFCRYNRPYFTKQELIDYTASFVEREGLKAKTSVIERDVDCFIRTYVAGDVERKHTSPEDTFACPLQELDLMQLTPDGELYRFAIGPKPTLPASVFAYALRDHFERARAGRNTMSIQECLYGDGSPGQVFKLNENSLIEYIEILEEMTEEAIQLDETAGLKQIYRRREFSPMVLLQSHYRGEALQ